MVDLRVLMDSFYNHINQIIRWFENNNCDFRQMFYWSLCVYKSNEWFYCLEQILQFIIGVSYKEALKSDLNKTRIKMSSWYSNQPDFTSDRNSWRLRNFVHEIPQGKLPFFLIWKEKWLYYAVKKTLLVFLLLKAIILKN